MRDVKQVPTAERADPDNIAVPAGRERDIQRFLDSDQLVRSGMCPNRCGLMGPCDYGQECPACHFSTNVLPDVEQSA